MSVSPTTVRTVTAPPVATERMAHFSRIPSGTQYRRGETVKACVTLADGLSNPPLPQELIRFCQERMAAYKYPRAVEIVPELPKTLSGKILRYQLREEASSDGRGRKTSGAF
jgi:acyl-coenzyme A synthetase/AMP-(fatty) acid ligase